MVVATFPDFLKFLGTFKRVVVCGCYSYVDHTWIAFGENLKALGVKGVDIWPRPITEATEAMRRDDNSVYIILCSQIMSSLPRHYVSYQAEQAYSYLVARESYQNILKKADWVIDYAKQNIGILEPKFPDRKWTYVPFTWAKTLVMTQPTLLVESNSAGYDLAFIGNTTTRRHELLGGLQQADKYKMNLAQQTSDDEWLAMCKGAKITLNIHAFTLPHYILETARLMRCLANDLFVISEHTTDPNEEKNISRFPSVVFVPSGDLEALKAALDKYLAMDLEPMKKQTRELLGDYVLGKV